LSAQFDKVKNWLLYSGLAISDTKNENCGGVHSFYDQDKDEYAFLYPEITGYYLSTLCFLYHIEKNHEYINLAKKSANWLIDIYDKYGGIVQGITHDKSKQNVVYSFDTAICAKGLIDNYLISKDEKSLEYGKKMCDWLIDKTIESDGTVKPLKDLTANEFLESTDVWYKQKGCLHIKTAIPLASLYSITNDAKLLDAVNLICNSVHHFQNPDGSLSLHRNDNVINLHTLCYALEGLVYGYHTTKNEKYLSSCKNAVIWCSKQIENDGSIHLWFNSKYKAKASYPIAQLLRIIIILDKIEKDYDFKPTGDKLRNYLISLQATNLNQKIDGGFYEEIYKSFFGWKKRLKLNSWASMFALQALYWYDNFEKMDYDQEINFLY